MTVVNKVIKQLKLDVLSIQDVPESFSSSVYKIELVNHQIVYLKIPYSKGKWQVELTALNRFLPKLPVPRVLDYWEGNEEITGALLLSAIDGNPLTARAMIEPRLAHQIGVQHAILHAIPILPADYNGAIVTMYEDWTAAMKRMFYSFAVDAEKALDRTLFRKAIDRFEQEHRFLPPPDGPCFVHMDFRAGNLLIKENTLKGIIDFESVKIGATEIDFHKLDRDLFSIHPGTLKAYEEGYRSVRPLIELKQILPFYRFTDAFNSIGWAQRRGIAQHRTFYEENLRYLMKLFA